MHATVQEISMANRHQQSDGAMTVTREDLVALLNEDLAGEYLCPESFCVEESL